MPIWKVRAYIEYDIEASDNEESIHRLTECLLHDIDEGQDIRDVAEVNSEKISEGSLQDAKE